MVPLRFLLKTISSCIGVLIYGCSSLLSDNVILLFVGLFCMQRKAKKDIIDRLSKTKYYIVWHLWSSYIKPLTSTCHATPQPWYPYIGFAWILYLPLFISWHIWFAILHSFQYADHKNICIVERCGYFVIIYKTKWINLYKK